MGAAVGGRAIRDVREVRSDLIVLGACAIDAEAGVAAFAPTLSTGPRLMLPQRAALPLCVAALLCVLCEATLHRSAVYLNKKINALEIGSISSG